MNSRLAPIKQQHPQSQWADLITFAFQAGVNLSATGMRLV